MSFKAKVALVTGSSTGIGRAVAIRFAREGMNVVVTSRQSVTQGECVVEEIKESGGSAAYCCADLTDEGEVHRLFDYVAQVYGDLDILVNNAGSPVSVPFDRLDKAQWVAGLDANVTSAVLCSLRASKIMMGRGGWIINTASIRGIDYGGRPAIAAYSAAKAAMINFTKTLAKELAPDVFVNAIAPGFVRTDYMRKVSQEMQDEWLKEIPMKRFIEPDELAEAYLFLAKSRIFTGSVLVPDGGFTLKLA